MTTTRPRGSPVAVAGTGLMALAIAMGIGRFACPAGSAVVDALGPIRQLVRGEAEGLRRYPLARRTTTALPFRSKRNDVGLRARATARPAAPDPPPRADVVYRRAIKSRT